MRITGGKARGIPLKTIPAIRPATDKMRQAVFSYLGDSVKNAHCLDLFAGSGSYGLEALSRGAISCQFIDSDRKVLGCLKENLRSVCRSMGWEESSAGTIIRADGTRWNPIRMDITIIFADPPYPKAGIFIPRILDRITNWFDHKPSEELRVIVEGPGGLDYDLGPWQCLRSFGKGKGDPFLQILRFQHHQQ